MAQSLASSYLSHGALLKVQGVLALARSSQDLRSALTADPVKFVDDHGIRLTELEVDALKDVLNGTAVSPYGPKPEGAPFDKMAKLQALWTKH
jgi:hypothetical protein